MTTPRTPTYLRRFALAIVFAAAAALGGTFGSPAIGSAKPNDGSSVREWDIEKFDACMARNPLPPGERYCCDQSGGVTDYKTGKCSAPSAMPAGQPQAPGQVPPDFGGPTATLWMPPPGPAAPPPNEAVR
jgi:hypothetical protein